MDKYAFLIIGPESSGTKLLTKLFIAAGCTGDAWHQQRFDRATPDESKIVYRRSYPHGGKWPTLSEIADRFQNDGYEVRVVVIVRSMQFTMASRRRHSTGNVERRARVAFCTVGSQLYSTGLPFVWLTYEELVQRPEKTLTWLFDWCGLPAPKAKINDGNAKYI